MTPPSRCGDAWPTSTGAAGSKELFNMIQIRKTRLLIAAPLVIGVVLSIDVVSKAIASDAAQAKLIGDGLTAVLFAAAPFFLPYLLRFLAVRRIQLEDLIGPVRADEIRSLIDQVLGLKQGDPRPTLFVLDSDKCEASCVGTGSSATIFVTRGLIGTLTPKSLLATIAHEGGHLLGKHLVLQGLIFSIIFFVGRTITAIPPAAAPLFIGLYLMIAWRFEFYADRVSALHVGPRVMQACCAELATLRGQSIQVGQKPKLSDYLSTHPTFAARIHRLGLIKGHTWQE